MLWHIPCPCRSQIAESLGSPFDDNWWLEDPTGKPDEDFRTVIEEIERKILCLKQDL